MLQIQFRMAADTAIKITPIPETCLLRSYRDRYLALTQLHTMSNLVSGGEKKLTVESPLNAVARTSSRRASSVGLRDSSVRDDAYQRHSEASDCLGQLQVLRLTSRNLRRTLFL